LPALRSFEGRFVLLKCLLHCLNVFAGGFLSFLHLLRVADCQHVAKLPRANLLHVRVDFAKGNGVRQMVFHHLTRGLVHFCQLDEAENAHGYGKQDARAKTDAQFGRGAQVVERSHRCYPQQDGLRVVGLMPL